MFHVEHRYYGSFLGIPDLRQRGFILDPPPGRGVTPVLSSWKGMPPGYMVVLERCSRTMEEDARSERGVPRLLSAVLCQDLRDITRYGG
jgi:hypothetical protein